MESSSRRTTRAAAYLRAAIVAGMWVFLMLRLSQSNWLEMPDGPTFAVADDVYITADYARTFASGDGPRWHPAAPRVEGFTSPLWLLFLAPFHAIPHFEENRLGLYVLALNALLLAATGFWLARLLEPILAPGDGQRSSALRGALGWLFIVVAPLAAASLASWAADGFEVVLVALLSVASFAEALAPAERLRERRIAVLLGLAFWTRMDAVFCCAPAALLVLAKLRRSRRTLRFAAWFASFAALLLISRKLYYGEWLPNTYYLKIAGWPLSKRLPYGLFQNGVTLHYYLYAGLPFLALSWYSLRRADRPLLLGLLPAAATLLYSTHNGGDFAWSAMGYDRYCAPALPLFVFSIGAVLFSIRSGRAVTALVAALATTLAVGPLSGHWFTGIPFYDARLLHSFDPRYKPPENVLLGYMIYDGKILRRVTRPAARVALCAAGAIIYFSRRKGADVLGKNDAHVAHLPAADRPGPNSRCFRYLAPPGHNKEDLVYTFSRFRPDVSLVEPPAAFRDEYVSFVADGHKYFGLDHSRSIDWRRVTDVKPLHGG